MSQCLLLMGFYGFKGVELSNDLRRICIVLLHGLVPGTFPGTSALWR